MTSISECHSISEIRYANPLEWAPKEQIVQQQEKSKREYVNFEGQKIGTIINDIA